MMMTFDNSFVVSLMSFLNYYKLMNISEAAMFLAIGFVPTLVALEMVYRMGRAIGKRGEIPPLAQHSKLKMLFA
ncbi:MAG: hypothetical protein ICV68_16120 [Pyrinomonadaceae bacterium]|nr:hypothetical protein [Pyrinomonadaceae bacterium]